MNKLKPTTYLIVNADDYGYFSCVSRGILDGALAQTITATGIMANSPHFDEQIALLKQVDQLDKGVHLNISYGTPLTLELQERFKNREAKFPNKSIVVRNILTGRIPILEIENEWRAQILRCLDSGVTISFLNSHEHLHMLPPLYKVFIKLVNEYQLSYSRHSTPEWQLSMNMGSYIRNALLFAMNIFNMGYINKKAPIMLGMNQSGKLTLDYLKTALPRLKPGGVYELMCHPGYFDSNEIQDPNLLAYHDWKGELDVLTSNAFKKLCKSERIQLVHYQELPSLV